MASGAKCGWMCRTSSSPQDSANESAERLLARIPTLFGQLIASGWHRGRVGFVDGRNAPPFSYNEITKRAVCDVQRGAFHKWLCLSLELQEADLQTCAAWSNTDMRDLLEYWLHSSRYLTLVPAEASVEERRLFLADLETLLKLERKTVASAQRRESLLRRLLAG